MAEKRDDKHGILRQRAEEIISLHSEQQGKISFVDIQQLIHELNVHQIELEMQNDELKQIRNELENEKERYQHLFEFAPISYVVTDEDGLIINANQTTATLFGDDKENIIKTRLSRYCSRLDAKDSIFTHFRKTLKTLFPQTCELTLKKLDGMEFEASLWSVALKSPDTSKPLIRYVISDVSEVNKLKKQLHHALKIEAIGTLTGGIAHDFNNILTVIIGNIELALSEVPDWNPAAAYLNEAQVASVRASDIIKQLLTFTRRSDEKRRPIHVKPIIDE